MSHRIFFSVGEPSGDIHAANLIHSLRKQNSSVHCSGFGGPRMAQAGCSLEFPLADHPIMGVAGAIRAIPLVRRLFHRFEQIARDDPPDALVLIDYPGFNLRLAKLARKYSIPVFYFVPPQIWAWASWRARRFRRCIDHVLCTLPFEDAWYRTRGIPSVQYVGHPFFDDLEQNPPDALEVERLRHSSLGPRVVLLPGSRPWEADQNGPLLLDSARKLVQAVGTVDLHVAAFNDEIAQFMRSWIQPADTPCKVHVGRTRELLAAADLAIAVSGSVSLELLHFHVPSVIVYKVPWHWQHVLKPLLLHAPYVTLVNLIAGRQVFPEFVGSSDLSTSIAQEAASLLGDAARRRSIRNSLGALCRVYGVPGANAAAADYILDKLAKSPTHRRLAAA